MHLRKLAAAGLSHVHLLPTFDFGSVPERPEARRVAELPRNLGAKILVGGREFLGGRIFGWGFVYFIFVWSGWNSWVGGVFFTLYYLLVCFCLIIVG